MDLAACDASGRGRGNGSEHTASRRRWPRDVAHGCLLYLVPTIIFFVVDAIGLWRLPGDFWGMYGNDDGIWAAWNLRGIFEWSRPFDLAPFNPLSGMGSTFLPNTPWLNPAALALALPLPREVTYLISYFVYFVELSLSLILLFRVVGLAPLEAIICAQLYLLILFPPTNGSLPYPHVVLARAGECPSRVDLQCAPGVDLDHRPLWSLDQPHLQCRRFLSIGLRNLLRTDHVPHLCASLCGCRRGSAVGRQAERQGAWLEAGSRPVVGCAVMARGLQGLFARDQPDLGPGVALSGGIRGGRGPVDVALLAGRVGEIRCLCASLFPLPALSELLYLSWFLHGSRSLRLSALDATDRSQSGMLLFFAFLYAFDFAGSISLFGSAHAISTPFLIWSSFPFTVLFLGLLIFRIAQLIGMPLLALSRAIAVQRIAQSWSSDISRGGNDPRHSCARFGGLAAANTLFSAPAAGAQSADRDCSGDRAFAMPRSVPSRAISSITRASPLVHRFADIPRLTWWTRKGR